jgi:rod shape-determining protein MreB
MKDSLKICIREIESLLERTPPEMQRTIKNNGIYICGGLSNMHGLSTYLSDALSLKVHTTESPEFCSANGLKKVIQSKELMKITYSMLDDNYRWMR